ncbi:N(5)-glutamine methyltransferas-like protein MTQ2 [Polyplosphaeria fusca]|uniref:N(5)-glutamine methyltransferas-like protein MTQ2 n=1 Tax=Polyplosphaeria fusca TaxID=682080 RepID=A0A9P4V693_9PLEO|nr:N(5)-glutamine methyltransferas-like protein MTQ2 [Polyplosphaeria fusca]
MLPTPSTSHVNFDRVYEPAEDSYLLLDTLSAPSETGFLRQRFNALSRLDHTNSSPPLVLEVGVGSGVVLAFIAANAESIFGRHDVLTLGTDINSFACRAASQTVQSAVQESHSHSIALDIVNGDLASCVRPHTVDVFVFNPPYVPAELPDFAQHAAFSTLSKSDSSTTFEQDSYLLELSYAGGVDGMEVTNRMLGQIPHILGPSRGVAYVLLCAQNKPEEVKMNIRLWGPEWRAETVGSSGKLAGWEKLQIVRIWSEVSS